MTVRTAPTAMGLDKLRMTSRSQRLYGNRTAIIK
jgi:hypothetical protein